MKDKDYREFTLFVEINKYLLFIRIVAFVLYHNYRVVDDGHVNFFILRVKVV